MKYNNISLNPEPVETQNGSLSIDAITVYLNITDLTELKRLSLTKKTQTTMIKDVIEALPENSLYEFLKEHL
ncbi:MAG: hypothetical protein K9K93_08225 [Acholeplasmataceae bacterium]|nr:hypothetical protein [Acholeplasmataceae bacterium]